MIGYQRANVRMFYRILEGKYMAEAEADRRTAEDVQSDFESKIEGFGKGRYGRLLQMAHTPNKEEYLRTAKISAIGIIVLGALGFVIMWAMTYLPTYF